MVSAWIIWYITWMLAGKLTSNKERKPESWDNWARYAPLMWIGIVLVLWESVYRPVHFEPWCLWVGGLTFAAWAKLHLASNWHQGCVILRHQKMVHSGPYAFFKHPMYVGFVTAMLGTAQNAATVLAWFGWFLFSVSFVIKADMETQMLQAHFKDKYPGCTKQSQEHL